MTTMKDFYNQIEEKKQYLKSITKDTESRFPNLNRAMKIILEEDIQKMEKHLGIAFGFSNT